MTTTAEKIKVMQAFEDGEEIESKTIDNQWSDAPHPKWDWHNNDYRIKPPDPEPLECWVVTGLDNENIVGASKSEPEVAGRMRKIPVRQITPQDEQDRKDAERLRYWQSIFGDAKYEEIAQNYKDAARFRRLVKMAGVAWQAGDTQWCDVVPGNLLREEIDKAMEEE